MTINITGYKFNKLIAIKYSKKDKYYNQFWLFRCDCGKEKIISKSAVMSGHTRSCGCYSLSLEVRKKRGDANKTHGMRNTRIYRIWKNMLGRTRNKNDSSYVRYGGRGIKVCKRWIKFENFYKDMGQNYKEHLTIERKNNDKGYYIKNCKWATKREQNRNKSNSIKYKNELAIDASKRLKGNSALVFKRLKRGWSMKNAFTIPLMKRWDHFKVVK